MTTHSQTESTNDTQLKRITKTDLNQLAQTQYGDKAYCEHVRSGQRGWYLHLGDDPVFLGTNITDAFHCLQTQNFSTTSSSTTSTATVTATTTPSSQTATILATEQDNPELPPPQVTAPTITDVARPPISPQQMLEILIEKFPHTFFKDPQKIRPIQKYIHKKIRRALNYEYTKEEVSAALAIYTQATDYCNQLILGGPRIDLEGNPCDEVSPKHIEDAKARIIGEKPMRPAKRKKRHATPEVPVQVGPPLIEELVTGKMELSVKIDTVPLDSKTVKNGWQEFTIEASGQIIKVTVRPKTWNKLQKAASEYPAWIAHLKGKMGERIKGGFELDQPSVQIFEKQPKGTKVEPETVAVNDDDS